MVFSQPLKDLGFLADSSPWVCESMMLSLSVATCFCYGIWVHN